MLSIAGKKKRKELTATYLPIDSSELDAGKIGYSRHTQGSAVLHVHTIFGPGKTLIEESIRNITNTETLRLLRAR
jgi:hypothetical protein